MTMRHAFARVAVSIMFLLTVYDVARYVKKKKWCYSKMFSMKVWCFHSGVWTAEAWPSPYVLKADVYLRRAFLANPEYLCFSAVCIFMFLVTAEWIMRAQPCVIVGQVIETSQYALGQESCDVLNPVLMFVCNGHCTVQSLLVWSSVELNKQQVIWPQWLHVALIACYLANNNSHRVRTVYCTAELNLAYSQAIHLSVQ